ncbi:MAG TPA: polysaccharide biosynthesis/export family protein [Planctomycetaceae bacterium]|jgi:polysaccharide export outer membrane protein|nr:polysaccharide biosynthesis/export family protein [Planctomycetaceae bacterium]
MVKNFRHVVLGLIASTAPLSAQVCSAQVGSTQSAMNVIPQRRAPQSFLVQDIVPAPAVQAPAPIVQTAAPVVPTPSAIVQTQSVEVPPPGIEMPVSEENQRASLRGVVLQSTQLTREGVALASKGATYYARTKFLTALQLVADALDARHNTQFHSRALSAGAMALREADDFGHPNSAPAGDTDPVSLAASHVTPLLRQGRPQSITRLQALQLYYSYATTQFAMAVGGIPEASSAICYLGRLQPFLGGSIDRNALLAEPKALALQQAALSVDPHNFRAANELGVLLAHCGQLEPARKALLYSASIERHPEIFQNLAYVYRELGDRPDAQSMLTLAAEERRQQTAGRNRSAAPPLVYVVDHKTFAGDTPLADSDGGAQTPPPAPGADSSAKAHPPNYEPAPPVAPQYAAPLAAAPGPQEFLEPLTWDVFAQGEYIGPARTAHVPEYYLRVDDQVSFVFRLNGKPMSTPYRLNVGDVIRINSLTMPTLSLDTPIQPDGTIILPQIGPVTAAGKSIEVLRKELDQHYVSVLKEKDPAISVVPITLNKTVEELRLAITNRTQIVAGQSFQARVSPNGTVQLPALGSVPAQGLSLPELRNEVEARYAELVPGVEVTPVLVERAPRVVYVLGEVAKPGKFPLDAPTTVIQAIALAGSWNIGGNLREVIIFRRDDCWRLMATRVNVRPALYNSRKLEADDIWLRDSDIVIVPKLPIQVIDDYVQLIFTKGIYGIVPFQGVSFTFFKDLTGAGAVLP